MELHAFSRRKIETEALPGPSAVICMADSQGQLATIKDAANVKARLNLIFNDTNESFSIVRPPTIDDARAILKFLDEHLDQPHLVIQCQAGVGRSQAVQAALGRMRGQDASPILKQGTYNRMLYKLMLSVAGMRPEPEPLVSMAVRVKYAPDRLRLFILSMQRQRHENWELVAVTDGPNPQAAKVVEETADPRIRLIQTDQPRGHWGHPYRQIGLDACRGEFIGMSNDDNYYVPGYFEQMLFALQDADLAVCRMLHSYSAWEIVSAGIDLGAWIARASLVRQVPWKGVEFTSDRDYIIALAKLAKERLVEVPRALFVHN